MEIINNPVVKTRRRKCKWNYDVYMTELKVLHEDKYDYTNNSSKTVTGVKSYLNITCKRCKNYWQPRLSHHLYDKTGCKPCSIKDRTLSLQEILIIAISIHGENFNYTQVKEEDIINTHSNMPITCNICGYFWRPNISDHIYGKHGCPDCAGNVPYTLERFINKAKKIHGELFDYSLITEKDIQGKDSNVPIICKKCNVIWKPIIHVHIQNESGCSNCYGNLKLTLEKVLEKSKLKHGDLYDYSLVKEEHIQNNRSKMPVFCKKCNQVWWPRISNHINEGNGCSTCKQSKGEILCADILKQLGLIYQCQLRIPLLPSRRFDFFFIFQDKKYLLEFDGQQHFHYIDFFHRDEENFEENREVDILKTNIALQSGYRVIRIDYTQIDNIESLIKSFLSTTNDCVLHLSNTLMYKYITDVLYPQITI